MSRIGSIQHIKSANYFEKFLNIMLKLKKKLSELCDFAEQNIPNQLKKLPTQKKKFSQIQTNHS